MSAIESVAEPVVVCGVSLNEAPPADGVRWGHRTVRVLEAGTSPRAMLARLSSFIHSHLSSLWDRGVYLLSPARSVHAQVLVRQGLEATDRSVAQLLEALTLNDRRAFSVEAVNAAIESVRDAGEPVFRHADDATQADDALLRARLPFQFEKLSLSQIDRIREGLQACRRSGSVVALHLQLIGEVLERAAAPRQRRMDRLVEAARYLIGAPLLEAEPTSEGQAVALMEEMYVIAAALMRAHGLDAQDRRMQCSLVMQGMSAHISAENGHERERSAHYARILALMPAAQLHALGLPMFSGAPAELDLATSFVKLSALVEITAGGDACLIGPIDYRYALNRRTG